MELIRRLDAVCARAWAPFEQEESDGWVLRAAGGFSLRANSVWPREALGAAAIDERIARAEAFYAARRLTTHFQISPASTPADLEAELASRGYTTHTVTDVMTAPVGAAPAAEKVELSGAMSDEWRAVMLDSGPGRRDAEGRVAIAEAIRLPRRHALVRVDGEPAAIGLGVLDDGWLGVFTMRTHPRFRRRGLARAVVAALLSWAKAGGAGDAYLQVERDNEPAIALYRGLGFVRLYGYRYCSAPKARALSAP